MPYYSFAAEAIANDIDIEGPRPGSNDQIGNMLLQSMNLIGIPYKWGGNTPSSGLDCSGFIRYVFKKSLGITLPRTANEMAMLGKKIPFDQLQPGDLVFFKTHSGRPITHVGMYLGNNQFIQAPRTGKDIQISALDEYYRSKFVVAKRMVEEDINEENQTVLDDIRSTRDPVTTRKQKPVKKSSYKRRKI
ncbi:MAG: peptidoglycan endopeptidase [Burkholderiales bacterium]|jgi:cell wall-associated NlpC family hydrolase|nr:peptidoglycan endopeptidase [Burkholderiales bacterium]